MTKIAVNTSNERFDADLQALLLSAKRVGYTQCIADMADVVGKLSLEHPKACMAIFEAMKEMNKKALVQ